jgi:hypothetical protein
MVEQIPLNLNVPLDVNSESTLSKTPLTPQLATASTVLVGDYYVQQQGKLNKYILLHRITVSISVVLVTSIMTYKIWDYIAVSDSIGEFLRFFLVRDFIFEIVSSLPVLLFISAIIGIVSYLISDDLKEVSKKLIKDNYVGDIFGFDLVKLAKIDKDAKLSQNDVEILKQGENTLMLVYRNSPIAIASVVEAPSEDPSTFVVKITGLHVRKVFEKVEFDQLLLDWCISRSYHLFKEYAKSKKIENTSDVKIQILIDAYNWDEKYVKTIVKNKFVPKSESWEINPFSVTPVAWWQLLANKLFLVKRITYELTLSSESEEKGEVSQSTVIESNTQQQSNKNSIRKRH